MGATVGPMAFTVEAADDAGNTASRSHVYSVVYDFDGFFSPVDDPPTFNAVKAGRDIPVKFSLGGGQGLDIFAEGYPRSGTIPADLDAPLDERELTEPAGESRLSCDPTMTGTPMCGRQGVVRAEPPAGPQARRRQRTRSQLRV